MCDATPALIHSESSLVRKKAGSNNYGVTFKMYNYISILVVFTWTCASSALICNIAPSPEICSNQLELCITLSQFATNTCHLLDSNTTVIVLEGEHSLESQFSVEHIVIFSMSTSQKVVIKCKNSTMFRLHNIGYVRLYNLKFRGCQLAVQRVNNLFLVNVEISNLTITFTAAALQLLQTSAMIFNSFFSKITVDFGAAGGIIEANQCNVTIEMSTFEACRAYDGIALLNGLNSSIKVIGSTFRNMELSYSVSYSSGGIFYINKTCTAVIYNSTFFNNKINATVLSSETSSLSGIIIAYGNLNISSCYFMNNNGGAIQIQGDSTVNIERSMFTNNSALSGGALYVKGGEVSISECSFTANIVLNYGGAVYLVNGTLNISGCTFQNNYAQKGGGLSLQYIHDYSIIRSIILHCDFINNTVTESGGAVLVESLAYYTNINMHCIVIECRFINNTANLGEGGAVYVSHTTLAMWKSFYAYNSAICGGALATGGIHSTTVNVSGCIFTNNKAYKKGGAIHIFFGKLFVINNDFHDNEAASGGALYAKSINERFTVLKSNFSTNKATNHSGGAVEINFDRVYGDNFWLIKFGQCVFKNNIAITDGGSIIFKSSYSSVYSKVSVFENHFINNQAISGSGGALAVNCLIKLNLIIIESDFKSNKAKDGGAIFMIFLNHGSLQDTLNIIKSNFRNNTAMYSGGALKAQGKIIFTSIKKTILLNVSQTKFDNNTAQLGGGILLLNLTTIFTSNSTFTENFAVQGGALFTNFSYLYIHGQTLLIKNTATDSGGGVYLNQSELSLQSGGLLKLLCNTAKENGGGIYSRNSSIMICFKAIFRNMHVPAIVFSRNHGEKGGGIFLSKNSIIKIFNYQPLNKSVLDFIDNLANYGQEIFVHDDSISQCFIQLSHKRYKARFNGSIDYVHAVHFSLMQSQVMVLKSNFGLCKVHQQLLNESENLKAVSNIQNINMGSLSLKLSFCKNGSPELDYQPSLISRKTFSIQVALVDQFSHAVSGTIISRIDGGSILSHQRNQEITNTCTTLNFTVFSSSPTQELILSPLDIRDPYHISRNDQIKIPLTFRACISCPIGFEKSSDEIKGCSCVCNTAIKQLLTKCDESSGIITKEHTTTWIGYINSQNSSGYLIYHYCPLNYCLPPDFKVRLNLNILNGADAQCVHNRSGLLCGACSPGLSLSLGSSHCVLCSSQWPGTLVAIIIGSILAGIFLVALILVLNLTVAIGTLNGLIFYANIAAANSSTFFTSKSILSIIMAWMNLELGIDTCFFEGMDAYWKTWIELAFPVYVIFLITVIIIVSEKSIKFSKLIGQKNPVATLDTLILLAYVKFLRIIISSYSFAILDYPDHSQPIVWLPDATVSYFGTKHIALFIAATFILLLGITYTMLLFSWQWLLYHQNKKVLRWIRHQRLCMFLEPYHAPYTIKHRYWTGLLLLVRIVLYITSSVTNSIDPRINIMITGMTALVLLMLGYRKIYKSRYVKLLEVTIFANIALLCIALLYFSKSNKGQEIVSYISGSIVFTLLIIVLAYHCLTEICFKTNIGKTLKRKARYRFNKGDNEQENLISNINTTPSNDERMSPTHSVVDPPPRRESVPLNKDEDRHELKILSAIDDTLSTDYHLMK